MPFGGVRVKQTINVYAFRDAFNTLRPNNFTYDGLTALYDFLDEVDPELELDVIGLCCEFTEYKDLTEFHADYGLTEYPNLEAIQDATILIETEGSSFIIADF